MPYGDPPPPRGMYWTDAAGWQPMSSGGWTLDEALRAHFTPGELARKPTALELRCEAHDSYDGKEPPTCEPMCIACIERWQV